MPQVCKAVGSPVGESGSRACAVRVVRGEGRVEAELMLKLLPDGHIGGNPSIEQVMRCPWFWNKKNAAWEFRPEWVGPGAYERWLEKS